MSSRIRKYMSPFYWKKGMKYLQRHGASAFLDKVRRALGKPVDDYPEWFAAHRVTEEELEAQRAGAKDFALRPVFSICVPLYNTRPAFLKALVDSVEGQSYSGWELCLADGSTDSQVQDFLASYLQDERIRYRRLEKNLGIAGNTNCALDMAGGDFILLADHDDFLERDALYELARRINEKPDTDILYTDEDLTDVGGRVFSSPRFKPDYNPDFLCSINYICHIFAVRADIMKQAGGFREEMEGAQDWDMILRCCEQTDRIEHIARILYHWRAHPDSTAGNPDSKTYAIRAGERAVTDHFRRQGIRASLDYTGTFILFQPRLEPSGEPKISIIICNKDLSETLAVCVRSIEEKSTYRNFEILIVENNSTEEKTFDTYKALGEAYSNVRIVTWQGEFNYSALNNFGADHAEGDYFIFLNNDTEVITPDWMERMLGYCQRENTGAVGAKLYYEDRTVQHCGVVVGVGGFAGHIETGSGPEDAGYFGRLLAVQDVSAVTAACIMVRRSVFEEVKGLDPSFQVALNDIDLCLRIRRAGYLIVQNPSVELFHFESKSRGAEDSPEKHERFKSEIRRFRERWKEVLEEGDPYYSPHLTLMFGDCRIRRFDEYFEIIDEIEREKGRV